MGAKGSPGKNLGVQGPRSMGGVPQPLSLLCRWYIYAIHGCFSEVMFTATWTFVEKRDWKLQGVTSIWALFIYGTAGLVLERLHLLLKDRLPLFARGIIYTFFIYLWEFSTGYVLRCFGACPWDYSKLPFNVMGLITFAYFPFWFLGSLLLEQLINKVLQLRLEVVWKTLGYPGSQPELKDH